MLPPANWKIGDTIAFWNLKKTMRCKILLTPWSKVWSAFFRTTHPCRETALFSTEELKFEGIMLLSWTLEIRLAVTGPQGQHTFTNTCIMTAQCFEIFLEWSNWTLTLHGQHWAHLSSSLSQLFSRVPFFILPSFEPVTKSKPIANILLTEQPKIST